MKRIACILLVLICSFCIFACSKFDESYVYDGKSLIGKWCEEDYDEASYITYEFFKDGTAELREYKYGIEFSKDTGTYTVDKNVMIIKFVEEYSSSVYYVENKFSITEDGELVMVYLDKNDEMSEEEMVLVPYNIDFVEDNSSIVGTWEDKAHKGEYWTFKKDYTGTISAGGGGGASYTFYYSVNDDCIYIANEFVPGIKNDLIRYDFDVDGDTLELETTINGTDVKLSFTRR